MDLKFCLATCTYCFDSFTSSNVFSISSNSSNLYIYIYINLCQSFEFFEHRVRNQSAHLPLLAESSYLKQGFVVIFEI